MRETRCMLDEPQVRVAKGRKHREIRVAKRTYTVHISCSIVRLLPKLVHTKGIGTLSASQSQKSYDAATDMYSIGLITMVLASHRKGDAS